MEAIVLAGGFGTRLRDVVPDVPKPMAPVCGRPFLEILLRSLSRKGIGRVVLSLGFMANKVSTYFGSSFAGMDIDYVREEHPLGTGGAVRLALSCCSHDPVFIFNGDTFLDLDIKGVQGSWQKSHCPIIVGREVVDAARYGKLLTRGNYAAAFAEKGFSGPGLINAGCYLFSRELLDGFRLNTPFSLENDYLAHAVKSINFEIFVSSGMFIDIGVPEDYLRAQTELSDFL